MIKLIDLLVRQTNYTHEEFATYLNETHAPLAADLPGVVKYTTGVTRDPEKAGFDGVAELYFEDIDALKDAFASDVGEAVLADANKFIDTDAGPTLIVEETVHVPDTQ